MVGYFEPKQFEKGPIIGRTIDFGTCGFTLRVVVLIVASVLRC